MQIMISRIFKSGQHVLSPQTIRVRRGERGHDADGIITIEYRRSDSYAGCKVRFIVAKMAQYSHILREPYGPINSSMSRAIGSETLGFSLSSATT